MIKVKIISSGWNERFEKDINDFIKDKEVIDIQYQSLVVTERGCNKVIDRALIVYAEGEHEYTVD